MEEENVYLFNNKDEFQLLIGNSHSYQNLQNMVCKLVGFIRPNYCIEFGSGSGETSIRIAKENPHTSIVAVDVRENVIEESLSDATKNKIRNVTFVNADLTKLNHFNLKNCNLVLMFFSFKYIVDPIENKLNFLNELYKKMQKGAYFIIADTFVNDNSTKQDISKQFSEIFENNSFDAFWNSLNGIDDEDIENAKQIKIEVENRTLNQAKMFANRKGVFPISQQWLIDAVENIGFKVIINEKLNSLNDALILLQK